MIAIDDAYIDGAAPNAEAARNGRALVLKGKFLALHKSEADDLLFGQCQGSGKEPYACSADFAVPEKPTYRCSCPSRQFPCKHSLGLLYAYAQGKAFSVADVPESLAAKRDKAAARVEKKKEEPDKPRTVNKSALAKKIKAQLDGIDLLEKLTLDLVRLGIGNTNAKSASEIEAQAKQLAAAYLPGAEAALRQYTRLFAGADGVEAAPTRREAIYSDALDLLCRLYALAKQGRAYLTKRLEDPELKPETESGIAAWLGHAWQLRELQEAGLVQKDAELIQLAFHTHDDVARKEYVDSGIWMNLQTGRIQLTQTFRPYRAAKFIKSEDSFFQVAQIPELCVYPGDVNPRVRWEGMLARPIAPADYATVRRHAHADFMALVKDVKAHLKGPLSDKAPVFALAFARIGKVDGSPVVEDAKGARLAMTDVGLPEEPPSLSLLPLVPAAALTNAVLVARFRHDLDTRSLRVKPLAFVTDRAVVRLTF